jgi:hypothetical protein
MSDYYNGYSPLERKNKHAQLKRLMAAGEASCATPPCQLCGDPDTPVEYHSEDYSKPYIFLQHALCRACHRTWLHKRFSKPFAWEAFKAHLRRGGYARETSIPSIKRELKAAQDAARTGNTVALARLRPRKLTGAEWWEGLGTDRGSLRGFDARPRAREEVASALAAIDPGLTPIQWDLLWAHLATPSRTATFAELANAVGLKSWRAVNLAYGKTAKEAAKVIGYDAPRRHDGTRKFMLTLCHAAPDARGVSGFKWTMNRSLVEALEGRGR